MKRVALAIALLIMVAGVLVSPAMANTTELKVMIFGGGNGSDWVKQAAEEYAALHPNVTVNVIANPRIEEQLRPLFISGNPPDVVSPGPNFDIWGAITNGEMMPLDQALKSPSFDGTGTWRETFNKALLDIQYQGKTYGIPQIFSTGMVWWYNAKLFRENGWEVPKTWDDLYKLNTQARATGRYLFALQGIYPNYYFGGLYLALVQRIGGTKALEDAFNLVPGAWTSQPFLKAAEETLRMKKAGFFLLGTMALNHTDSQTQFFLGHTLFVMAGTWLEGEMKSVIPKDFELRFLNYPAYPGGKGDPTAIQTSSGWGGGWYVPAKAKHPELAIDFLKYLTSRKVTRNMMRQRGLLSTVKGTQDALVSEASKSVLEAMSQANSTYAWTKVNDTYPKFTSSVWNAYQGLLIGDYTAEEFCKYAESQAEKLRNDDSIVKREFHF